MVLTEMLASLKIEVQDNLADTDELERAVVKTVSLMSRLLPKRSIVETIIGGAITGEALTIASNTGTLAYKPIKANSLKIPNKIEDTHFSVNYLTGIVTEIGSGLPDDTYTVSYDRDSRMMDISSVLPDYIRLERIEYPAGQDPPINPTFDLIGDYILIKGQKVTLSSAERLRLIYLGKWTPPTISENGDYPSHLDNAIIIGSAGQYLIYKAEKYVQNAISALSVLEAPTDYTIVKPSSPTLPDTPTAPIPPTPSYTAAEAAMTAVGTEITAAKDHHTSGVEVINAGTRGENVAANYGLYASTIMSGAGHRVNEAVARLRQIEEDLTLYASKVTAFGSEVNTYANQVSGLISKYREDINNEVAGVNNFGAQVTKYQTQITEQEMKARNFLDIAGRYLASGQAKINEFLVMLGLKPEFYTSKSLSEQRD